MLKKLTSLALAAMLALSLTACGGQNADTEPVDLAAFAQSVMTEHSFSEFLELADPSDEASKQLLDNFYPGLSDLELEQSVVYLCGFSMNNGEFALAQAKSEADAAAVKDIFQARVDGMVDGGAFYPEATEIWTNQSEVVVNGCYVMMVVHEDHAAIVQDFNALF